jgi:hypothetical protein
MSAGDMTIKGTPYKPEYKASVTEVATYSMCYLNTMCLKHVKDTSFPSKWGLIRPAIALFFLINYSSEALLLLFMSFYKLFEFFSSKWEKRSRLKFGAAVYSNLTWYLLVSTVLNLKLLRGTEFFF